MRFGENEDNRAKCIVLRADFGTLHRETPLLAHITHGLMSYAQWRYGLDLAITSILRRDNPRSVHAWWRGLDIGRLSSNATGAQMTALAEYINGLWVYSGGGNLWVAVFGDLDPKGRHWDHMHLQVHPTTHLR